MTDGLEDVYEGWESYELDDPDEVRYFLVGPEWGIIKLYGKNLKKYEAAVTGNGKSQTAILSDLFDVSLDPPNDFVVGIVPEDFRLFQNIATYFAIETRLKRKNTGRYYFDPSEFFGSSERTVAKKKR